MAVKEQPTKRIVFMRPDGGMSIVVPCISTDDDPKMTKEDSLERARGAVPPDAISPVDIEESFLPQDTTFRDAWQCSKVGLVSVEMAKAREIWKTQMRRAREPKLAKLDVEYMRADETGDTLKKAQLAAKKQALRDVTSDPRIATATTPEELKAVWPAALSEV